MVRVAIDDVAANIVASFLPGLFTEHHFVAAAGSQGPS